MAAQAAGHSPMAARAQTTHGTESTLNPRQFQDYKEMVLRPSLESACLRDVRRRMSLGPEIPPRIGRYCKCYADVLSGAFTQEEAALRERGAGKPSDAFTKRATEALWRECQPPSPSG
jgi:hypothetical protein